MGVLLSVKTRRAAKSEVRVFTESTVLRRTMAGGTVLSRGYRLFLPLSAQFMYHNGFYSVVVEKFLDHAMTVCGAAGWQIVSGLLALPVRA
jgi:hypothetical protein